MQITSKRRRKPQRVRKTPFRPELDVPLVLRWADAFFARKKRWPNVNSGLIHETIDDTWRRIDDALRRGYRGLSRHSRLSLARLLEKYRGVRNSEYPPKLTEAQIIGWAKNHHRQFGRWPNANSGRIDGAPGETWLAIDMALRNGRRRGLSGGSSLACLLERRLGVRNPARLPRLQIRQILAWADEFYQRTGRWPNGTEGATVNVRGDKWCAINAALTNGRRGLPGGSSLPQLLAEKRGARRAKSTVPRLTCDKILRWAKSYRLESGKWPTKRSGPTTASPGDTWDIIDSSLRHGFRGLAGGSSLAKLLNQHRQSKRTSYDREFG